MSISCCLDVLCYHPGGGSSEVTVFWWVPDGESSSEHAANIVRVLNSVEIRLPVYHMRQMRRDFYQKYGGLRGMSPIVLRFIYFDITGDATQMKASKAVDERMRLYPLEEVPEVANISSSCECRETRGIRRVLWTCRTGDSGLDC